MANIKNNTLMTWSTDENNGIFYQFDIITRSCTVLQSDVSLCCWWDLWTEQTANCVRHVNISPSLDFDLQYTVSAPTFSSIPNGPKLNYSLCPRFPTNGSCAEFFSCPSVNTKQLRGQNEAGEEKWNHSAAEHSDLSWITGFVPEVNFKPSQVPLNIWM